MERNALIEESLARAFQLAYFIHGDKETALSIAAEALAKLEVATAAQDKRLYYTPTGRAARAGSERFRTKVSVGESHLLQRLVYVESEPYERQAEQASNGRSSDEEDMIIHFIKHLVRITIRRNSFYVTLGLSRLLHNYSTAETMEMYNVVVQDPGRVRDDYYYRSRKGRLMKELKERFGDRLSVTRGARGEERFQTDDSGAQHAELARECLQAFTPWSTNCSIPAGLDPLAEEIQALSFDGADPDQEHAVEVNRFHAVLHPDCFTSLATSLNFAPPAERLATPHFSMSKDKDQDGKPPRRSRRAPQLDEAEMNAVRKLLAERASRRKTVAAGLLRVIVDGSERARLDINQADRVRFEAHENDELIEVRSEDGLLLATHLLNHGELPETERPWQSSIVLERGQRLSFDVTPARDASGETASAMIDLSYRETRLSRAAALRLRRFGFAAADFLRQPGGSLWKPSLAFAALMIIALGLMLYWRSQERAPKQRATHDQQPQEKKSPAPPSPAPATSPAHRDLKSSPSPAPRTSPDDSTEKPLFVRSYQTPRAPQPNIPEPQTETGPEIEPGLRNDPPRFDDVALAAVKKVHVDPFGSDAVSQQFRDQLVAALRTNRRFTVTTNRDEADAVLKGKMTAARAEQVSLTVRLVNDRGNVIWPVKGSTIGKQYQGAVAAVANQIAKDLLADMDKAERK